MLETSDSFNTTSAFEREMQTAAKATYTPQNYDRLPVNIQSRKSQKQPVSTDAQKDRTAVFAGIDELPDINALSKSKQKSNNNVLKSMVNKVKVKE